MSIKAFLWNARGWRSKNAEIVKRASDFDIIFITETKSKRKDHLTIPGFDTYVRNECRQGEGGVGGVAIFIKKQIKRQEIDLSRIKGNFDTLGVRVVGEKEAINFVCLYRRPGKIERKGVWKEIIQDINKRKGIIILVDFNPHHTVWNYEDILGWQGSHVGFFQ